MLRSKSVLLVLFLAALFLVAGCVAKGQKQGEGPEGKKPTAEKNTVIIQNFTFNPSDLIVSKGETVTWVNQD